RYWTIAFGTAGLGAGLGAVYHGGLKAHHSLAGPAWTLITLFVAVTLSYLLAGTVAALQGAGRGRFWLWRRLAGRTPFAVSSAAGYGGLGTLVITESVTMAAILGLWVRAWRGGKPGAGTVVLAMAVSAAGGALRTLPIAVHLGWTLDGTVVYHLLQIPGL